MDDARAQRSRRMQVVFVNRFCHPDHSATSQLLSDLATSLVEDGIDTALIAGRQLYDRPDAVLPRAETWRGVRIHRIRATRFGRGTLVGRAVDYLSFYASLPWRLWRLLRPGDVVVAMTDPPLLSMIVTFAARLRGAQVVNWLQDVFPEIVVGLGQPRLPRALVRLLQWLRNRSLAQAAMNVAIGKRMAEYLVTQGISRDRLQVIANWAHEEWIRPMAPETSLLRRSLGLQDHFVVGYFGNLGRAHDWRTILDAARRLSGDPGIAFVISGGGHGYEALRQQVEAAHMPNFHFLPYQPIATLSDAMAAADLHLVSLLPELEGQIVPSKFYGIAASGRAIGFIGDPDGELARLIDSGDCGFVAGVGQGASLAENLLSIRGNSARCQELGAHARALLDERFSREQARRQWRELLGTIGRAPQCKDNPTADH